MNHTKRTSQTCLVSRHPGALDWFRAQGVAFDRHVAHLCLDDIQAGDTVIGTLPINIVAQLCQRGARYLHLSLQLPPEARGLELTAGQMNRYGARLAAYRADEVVDPRLADNT